MKFTSESESLKRLEKIKSAHQNLIGALYETKAKSCLTCENQGVCCTDEHFVNIRISRLEAVAVRQTLRELGEEREQEIYARAAETVGKYDLENSDDDVERTFACPLFEKGVGCLVHRNAKPAPCIQHACYENRSHLPPDELLTENENAIERLNAKTYGANVARLPLPVWLKKINPHAGK